MLALAGRRRSTRRRRWGRVRERRSYDTIPGWWWPFVVVWASLSAIAIAVALSYAQGGPGPGP